MTDCPSCCPICGQHYPVIVMRQDCEAKHAKEQRP